MEPELQALLDESAIKRLVHLYCRGVDRLDAPTLSSIYAPGAQELHGGYEGDAEGFQAFALSFMQDVEASSHYIAQCLVDLRGDKAVAESYCIAYSVGMPNGQGQKVNLLIGARYIDRCERLDGDWKITERRVVFDWNAVVPGNGRWAVPPHVNAILGDRGAKDPIFSVLGSFAHNTPP